MTSGDRRSRIDRIRALPAALEAAVRGLNENQLDTPYREGGWTVRQVVHHLADSHINAFVRMKLILTEDHPTLKPYDQDSWAALPDTTAMPIGVSMEILRGLHDRWCKLLETTSDSAWQRSASHPERGEVTLESMLEKIHATILIAAPHDVCSRTTRSAEATSPLHSRPPCRDELSCIGPDWSPAGNGASETFHQSLWRWFVAAVQGWADGVLVSGAGRRARTERKRGQAVVRRGGRRCGGLLVQSEEIRI
jgi:hypothetical protein